MGEIKESVIQIIREIAEKDLGEIDENTSFFEELEFDSILCMDLLVEAETRFGFDSEDSEESLQAFETVGQFIEFVKKHNKGETTNE